MKKKKEKETVTRLINPRVELSKPTIKPLPRNRGTLLLEMAQEANRPVLTDMLNGSFISYIDEFGRAVVD